MSQQEKIKLRLAVFTFFVAYLTTKISSSTSSLRRGFPESCNEYRRRACRAVSLLGVLFTIQSSRRVSRFDKRGLCCVSSQDDEFSVWFPSRFDRPPPRSTSSYHASRLFAASTPRCPIPTSGATGTIVGALGKLQAATTYHDPKPDFLKKYAYDFGLDDLVKYGAHQYVIGSRQLALCSETFTLFPRLGLTLGKETLPTSTILRGRFPDLRVRGDLRKFYSVWYASQTFIVFTPPILCFVRYGGLLEPSKASTNSSAASQTFPLTTAYRPTVPSTSPLKPSHSIGPFVSFLGDSLIVGDFAAVGLFNQTNGPLDTTNITKDRTWIASEMVPLSGHMIVKKLSCSARPLSLASTRSWPMRWWNWVAEGNHEGKEEYVRILVNDARRPVEFYGADEDNMCKLDEFV